MVHAQPEIVARCLVLELADQGCLAGTWRADNDDGLAGFVSHVTVDLSGKAHASGCQSDLMMVVDRRTVFGFR